MKKLFFLAAAIGMLSTAYVKADSYYIPRGNGENPLATSDYGGVDYSTVSFSSATLLCFSGKGVFQGIIISSFTEGLVPTEVMIRDTESVSGTGTDFNTHAEVFRIVLDTNTVTSGGNVFSGQIINGIGMRNFTYRPPHPVRVDRGLAVKFNDNTVRFATPLWTKFE